MQSTIYRLLCCIALALVATLTVAQTDPTPAPYDGIIEIELHYPTEVKAGGAINLRATVTNNGRGTYVVVTRMGTLSGNHADSYSHHRPCEISCNLGSYYVAQDEPMLIDLGNYYYDAPTLFAGTLVIAPPTISVFGSDQDLHLTRDPDAEDAVIEISGPAVPEQNLAMVLPVRDALQPGEVIHDPNTDYDWLPLVETEGMLLEDIDAATESGGTFEGFRLASREQVETMLLNHLHAAGINVRQHALYQPVSIEMQQSLAELQDWFGIPQPDNEEAAANGLIANRYWSPVLDGNVIRDEATDVLPLAMTVLPSADACSCNEGAAATGIMRVVGIAGSDGDVHPSPLGAWLVRTPSALPERPQGQASFYQNVLRIPAVEVDDILYEVELGLVDLVSGTLRLLNAKPATDATAPVHFDQETGVVEIPDTLLITDDGYEFLYDLTLTYRPLAHREFFEAAVVPALP